MSEVPLQNRVSSRGVRVRVLGRFRVSVAHRIGAQSKSGEGLGAGWVWSQRGDHRRMEVWAES